MDTNSLQALPEHILRKVVRHLTLDEAMRLRETCKDFSEKILQLDPSAKLVHDIWEKYGRTRREEKRGRRKMKGRGQRRTRKRLKELINFLLYIFLKKSNKPTFRYRLRYYSNSFVHRYTQARIWAWWILCPPYFTLLFFPFLFGSIVLCLTCSCDRYCWGLGELMVLFLKVVPSRTYYGVKRERNKHPLRAGKYIILSNLLWNIAGISLVTCFIHVIMAILQLLTIVGYPNAYTHACAAWMCFWPFGYIYETIPIPPPLPPDLRCASFREYSQNKNSTRYGAFYEV